MHKRGSHGGTVRDWALKLISARPLSRAELTGKLAGKGVDEAEIEDAAGWLEELGLLDDAEYAHMVVRHYSAKGYGIHKAKNELFRRGVPRELWEDALAELSDPAGAIDCFLSSRLGTQAERSQIRTCCQALLRRGFAYSDIRDGLLRRNIEIREE